MPLQQGDLSRAFMHDLVTFGNWTQRKKKILETMRQRTKERLFDVVKEYAYTSEEMQAAVDLLRAIVEVSPRGQKEDEKMGWRDELVEILKGWVE